MGSGSTSAGAMACSSRYASRVWIAAASRCQSGPERRNIPAGMKCAGLPKPQRPAIAATVRDTSAGWIKSRRQPSNRRCRIQPATVAPGSWNSLCRWRREMWQAAATIPVTAPGRPAVRR
jgi:hypothetical protein